MKEGPNDWGLTYNIDWSKPPDKEIKENRANFAVRICPKCNVAYEIVKSDYNNRRRTYYYEDFPSIGLPRKTCFRCS